MKPFLIVFMSIILEAMPFVMIGAFVSACIQLFVSEDFVERILPKRRWTGYIAAAFMGLIFPVCECAIIPITRRLIKKGIPTGMAVTFMLAVPIVNPIVLLSTYYAFNDKLYMVLARGSFGFLAAVTIGILIAVSEEDENTVLKHRKDEKGGFCSCGCETVVKGSSPVRYLTGLLEHTSKEFFNIMKYLAFGAFLSGLFETYLGKEILAWIPKDSIWGIVFMIGLAFVLSICSEVDAFIARTFAAQFSSGSILAFLIFGPMLDIKNTLILSGHFKAKFVIKLALYITLISIIAGLIGNIII